MNLDNTLTPILPCQLPTPILKEPTRGISKLVATQQPKISIDETRNRLHSCVGTDLETDKILRKSNYLGDERIQNNTEIDLLNHQIQGLVSHLKEEKGPEGQTRLPSGYTIEDIEEKDQFSPTLEKIQYDAQFSSQEDITSRLKNLEKASQKQEDIFQIERANHIFKANQKLRARTAIVPPVKGLLRTSQSMKNLHATEDIQEKKRHIDDNDL